MALQTISKVLISIRYVHTDSSSYMSENYRTL